MKFTINATLFKKINEAVKDLVKNMSLEFSSGGVVLNAMDSSHVSLVHMNIRSSLSEYTCDTSEVISLNSDTLSKILKTCENDAEITCENKENKLTILTKFQNRTMNFAQNLLEIETDTMMVPDFEFPCRIEMSCSEFQKVCRDLREFGDDVKVTVSPSTIKFYTVSAGEHIQIDYNQTSSVRIFSEACIEMSYSLKYLIFFCKACPLADFVHIFMGMEQPMRLKFPISETEQLSFYLAPKVDES